MVVQYLIKKIKVSFECYSETKMQGCVWDVKKIKMKS